MSFKCNEYIYIYMCVCVCVCVIQHIRYITRLYDTKNVLMKVLFLYK